MNKYPNIDTLCVGDELRSQWPYGINWVVLSRDDDRELFNFKSTTGACIEMVYRFDEINKYIGDGSLVHHPSAIGSTKPCRHEYKKYIGFTDIYNYCTKCGEKEQ